MARLALPELIRGIAYCLDARHLKLFYATNCAGERRDGGDGHSITIFTLSNMQTAVSFQKRHRCGFQYSTRLSMPQTGQKGGTSYRLVKILTARSVGEAASAPPALQDLGS